MSQTEFARWFAYYQLEPWGCHVEDHRFAELLNLTYQVNVQGSKQPPKWFDRDPDNAKREQTPEQLADNVREFFAGKTIIVKPA